MIELRTLGGVDLRGPDGASLGSVLAQPKRLALLIYLVLAGRGGFVRRDTILATFWPESDDARARAALRQAVHQLRRSLGPDVLVNRAEDELAVAAGAMRCDAIAFRDALDAGDLEGALALYGGDLLPGFHPPDAPGFERWLEDERRALRRRAAEAALALGRDARDPDRALAWARRAVALEPLDERAVRQLLALLAQAGDRAGAAAAFEDFRQRLAQELDLEPDPETLALVEGIRNGRDAAASPASRSSDPAAVTTPPEAVPAARAAAEPVTGAGSAPPPAGPGGRPRRRIAPRVAAGVGFAVVVGAALYAVGGGPGGPGLEPRRVVVAPFENDTGDPELAPIGRMAADWITEGISRTGAFEVVPATAVLAAQPYAASRDPAGPDDADARLRALARETGAGLVVSGAYYRQGAELHLQARILDAATGRVVRPVEPVTAPADSSVAGIDRLRARVLAALAPVGDTVTHARSTVDPPTYEAYRAYIQGLETFVRGDPVTALRHFERAARADAGYAAPRIAAAIMHMNLGDFVAADSLAAAVQASRERLGPLERGTLDMVLAMLRGDNVAAYRASVEQAHVAPGSIGEYMVAEMARKLNRPAEAVRVLTAMGPERGELRGWRAYWRELTWSHHMLGQHRRELRAARQARTRYPDDPAILVHEARALAALGRTDALDRLIDDRLANPSGAAPTAGWLMRMAGNELEAHGHPEAARRLFERSVAWYEAGTDGPPSRGHADGLPPPLRYGYGVALTAAGRLEEAERVFAGLVAEAPENLDYLGRLGALAARRGDRTTALRADSALAGFRRLQGRAGPINHPWGQHHYDRAIIAAWLGEPERAVGLLRQAHREGHAFGPHLHSDPDLAPLREHPEFTEFIRPRP
jgi:DNA-binding SARP family transcriptional activator/tetratricopeptide (TPR) repeat protein